MECANCNGTRICQVTGNGCAWCDGLGVLSSAEARRLAEVLARRAMDGRINGDMSPEESSELMESAKDLDQQAALEDAGSRMLH